MTVREITASPGSWTTAATFRTEGKKISDAISAVLGGRTTDTGQIDWATVAAAGAANTVAGYEVYRLAASGTAPAIFIKVEYGLGASTGWGVVWIQTATGTDGAGVLTGTLGGRYSTLSSTSFSVNSAQQQCLFSSDGSTYFWCSIFDRYRGSTAGPGMVFVLDRARNVDGTASPDGWMQCWQYDMSGGSVGPFTQGRMVNLKTGAADSGEKAPVQSCAFFGGYTSLAVVNDLYFYPHFFANPQVYSASPVILGMINTEITKGVMPSVVVYGTPRTFYSMGTQAGSWSVANTPAHGVMLRWDV